MHPDALSATLAALADPTRRAILARLAEGEATVTELAEPFAMSLPAVSRHIRVLDEAGLIARRRDAQRWICRLQPQPLHDLSAWLAQYRRFWEAQLDRMAVFLAKPLPTPKPPSKGSKRNARRPAAR